MNLNPKLRSPTTRMVTRTTIISMPTKKPRFIWRPKTRATTARQAPTKRKPRTKATLTLLITSSDPRYFDFSSLRFTTQYYPLLSTILLFRCTIVNQSTIIQCYRFSKLSDFDVLVTSNIYQLSFTKTKVISFGATQLTQF
jgi:hypothetical protein